MDIVVPKIAQKYVELQCNSELLDYQECPDVQNAMGALSDIEPKKCLEVGCGLGRVSVYLNKTFSWGAEFYMLDGDSGTEQIAGISYELKEAYYNSLSATKEFCAANGLQNCVLLDAHKKELPTEKIDLCYSFKAIGFHWPINEYLDILYTCLQPGALLLFGIRSELREYYSSDKIFDRRINFNRFQIDNIDTQKYRILQADRAMQYPVLVLKKEN